MREHSRVWTESALLGASRAYHGSFVGGWQHEPGTGCHSGSVDTGRVKERGEGRRQRSLNRVSEVICRVGHLQTTAAASLAACGQPGRAAGTGYQAPF